MTRVNLFTLLFCPLWVVCFLAGSPHIGWSQNWPQWRGPTGDGHSPDTDVPLHWGIESGEVAMKNLAWKSPLAGLGTSTPIIWDDLIVLTSQTGQGPLDRRGAEFDGARQARTYGSAQEQVSFHVIGISRETGSERWRHSFTASSMAGSLPAVHPKHSLASPSVVTDGESIYAWFGTGQLVALTLEGKPIWSRDIGKDYAPFDVLWGHGSSPALVDGLLVLQCDHPPGAYLVALDKRDGKQVWKTERGPGLRSYSTPYLINYQGSPQLIVNSSHRVEAFNPETGELLWHAGEPVTLAIPMPVLHQGTLYASRGYSSGPFMALSLDPSIKDKRIRWKQPTRAPYISSMIANDGHLYMATERGIVFTVAAETGETVWRKRFRGVFTASPVVANDHVFITNEDGETLVFADADQPELIATNRIEARTLASLAISQGQIFIRTDEHLLAFGTTARQ